MIKRFIFILSTVLIVSFSFGQNEEKIDSLKNKLKTTQGKEAYPILKELCNIYITESPEITIQYAMQLLELADTLESLKIKDIATSYLGEAYFYMDEIDNSIYFFKKYLEVNQIQNDTDGIATGHNNLGIIYRSIEDYENSINHYIKSLEIKEMLEDTVGISNTLNNLGVLYFHLGRYDKAIEYYEHSLKIETNINNKEGIATSLLNIGEILGKMNEFNRSISYLQQSIDLAEEINDIPTLELAYKTLAEVYKFLENYPQALVNFERFHETRERRINQETKSQIAELEIQYQSKQQQKEIVLLNKQKLLYKYITFSLIGAFIIVTFLIVLLNRQVKAKKRANNVLIKQNEKIKEQSEILQQLNVTKDKFFSIISHDLKGAIGGFLSQTQFMAEDYDALSNKDKHELIEQLSLSSKRLFTLLENLLDWAKSQTGALKYDPEDFSLTKLIDSIVSIYKTQLDAKEIKLNLQISPQLRCYADINMVSSVIRNLLLNAIKFSYPHGYIKLEAERKNKSIEVTVSDQGVGIDDKIIKKLFSIEHNVSEPGTQEEYGTGLGLILSKEFVDQHGGNIWVESKKGEGATFRFTIPAAS